MRITCIGGGPAGLYFALLMKQRDPAHEITRGRAQPALRHLRLGRRVLRPDARQPARGRRARPPTQITDAFNHWDDIDVHFKRPHDHARAATASAASAASACSTSCRRAARRSASSSCSRPTSQTTTPTSPTPISSSPATASTAASATRYAEHLRARHRRSRKCRFVWLGTHKLFDAFTFAFEETEHGWFQAHAYQLRRRHLDLHRRDARGRLARGRPRPDGAGGGDRLLREAVRQVPRRPRADVERRAPARLGAVDQLPARRLRDAGCTHNGQRRRSC